MATLSPYLGKTQKEAGSPDDPLFKALAVRPVSPGTTKVIGAPRLASPPRRSTSPLFSALAVPQGSHQLPARSSIPVIPSIPPIHNSPRRVTGDFQNAIRQYLRRTAAQLLSGVNAQGKFLKPFKAKTRTPVNDNIENFEFWLDNSTYRLAQKAHKVRELSLKTRLNRTDLEELESAFLDLVTVFPLIGLLAREDSVSFEKAYVEALKTIN